MWGDSNHSRRKNKNCKMLATVIVAWDCAGQKLLSTPSIDRKLHGAAGEIGAEWTIEGRQ